MLRVIKYYVYYILKNIFNKINNQVSIDEKDMNFVMNQKLKSSGLVTCKTNETNILGIFKKNLNPIKNFIKNSSKFN